MRVLALLMAAGSLGASPAEAVRVAHADLARLPPSVRPYVRYLSMHHLTEKEGDAVLPVYWGHVNKLSKSALLIRPARVGMLLRVNLQDYGWDAATFDRLRDPYFSVTIWKDREEDRVWPGGETKEGKYFPPGTRYRATVSYPQTALAPWLIEDEVDKAKVAEVLLWTHSTMPVVRADWFFNQTAAQQNRDPGYYGFLGVKKEADVFDLVGFDRKLLKRVELREAVALSGVTLQPRAIVRFAIPDGALWKSIDFKLVRDERNPLKVLGRDIEKDFDASEGYATLPNGFWVTWAANGKGVLVDAVPGDIANDHASRSNDKQIHPNVSCARCHVDGGLQDVDGWYRNLLNPPLELRTEDYAKASELRQQYLRDLKIFIAKDRANYEAAVKEATGLDSKKYAAADAEEWSAYEDAKVDAKHAARDLGLTEEEFRKRILHAVKTGYPLDTVVSSFVHEGPRARALPIRVWEQSIEAAYAAMRATK